MSRMTSKSSTNAMNNARQDSVTEDCSATTTAEARTYDVTDDIPFVRSCLALFGLDDIESVPDPVSEFEVFCAETEIDNLYPNNHIAFRTFLQNKTLESRPKDLKDYPGIQHAASLLLRDSEAKDGRNFELLDKNLQDMLIYELDCRFASGPAKVRFAIGNTIGGGSAGKTWVLNSQLHDVSGSFNRGVYIVTNANHSTGPSRVIKTLPTPAHYPGFADREISILSKLDNDNIIRFFDGHTTQGRHETGWMVTEFCDKGTLKDLVKKYIEAKTSIPELFVWKIMESLVRAVVYLHYGPNLLNEFDQQKPGSKPLKPRKDPFWDPVYHRDIILANVFCTSSTGDIYDYPIVKLGDFGCAMRQSEVETKDEKEYPWEKETPIMDNEYEPPEGQYATKLVDVYQIGLLMWCIVQNTSCPCYLDGEEMSPKNFTTSSSSHCSRELRHLLNRCIKRRSGDRIDSLRLLHAIRVYRKLLIFENRLPFVELLP